MPRTFTNRPMGVADVKELQKRAKAARLRGDRPTSLRLLQQATQLKEAVFGTESDVAMLAKATTNLAIASAFSDEEQHAQAMRHAQAARQIIEESILPENQVTIERVRVLVKAYVAIGIEYEFSSQWGSALSAYRNARHLAEAYLGGSKLAAQHEKWAKARLHKSHVLQFCHSKMNSQLQSSLPEVHLIRTRDTRTGLAAIEVQRVPRAGPLKQDRQRRGVNKSPEKRRRRPRTASGVSPRSRNATPKIANRPTTAGNAKSRSADKKTRVDFFYPGNGANRESDEASDGANELVPPPFPDGLRFEFSSSNPQSYDSDESDGADDQATVNSGRTMDSSAALQSGLQVLVLTRPGFWSLRNAIRALAVIVAKDKAKSEREQALRAQAIENERREREERERREREALKQQQLAEQKLRARREAQEKFERERAEREEVRRREEAERARKAAEEARLRAEQDAAARREAERQRAEEEEKRQAEESRRAQEELELRRRQERERAAQMDAEMAQRAKVKKLLAEAARERWARLHRDAQLYYNAARKFQSLTRGYLLRKQREKHGTDFVSAHIKLAETAATEAVANKLDDDIICAQAQIAWAWDNLAVKLLQVNPGEHGGTVGGTFELPKQISLVYRDVKLHISDPFVVVEKLIQGGALEAAGAQELDAVLAVDGQQFKNMREFLALVDGKNAMTFQLVRMPEIPILEEFKVAVRRAIVARIRHETELKARAVVALGGALAELPENRAAQGQKRRREETRANAATQIQHLFRSYRADKVLREAHCVDGRVHSVPRELTDVVDAIDESALALNARVAWAWANEKVRSVHIKRGDDWQIAPLSFEAQLPGQVELAYRGMQLALSDPFLLITTLDSTSILCECGIHPGDAVLTVDGEDFSDVATFSKRVAGKREMVWQVVSMDAEIPETELDEHKQRVLTAITLRLHHEVKMRDFFSTQSKGTTIASRTLPLRYEQKALTLNCLRGFLELLPVHTRKAVGNMKLGFHRAPFLCSVAAAVESTGQLAYVDAAQASRATMPDHATWLEAKFKRWQKLYAPKHSDGSPTQSPKSRLRARPTIEFIERHNKIAKLLAQKVGVRRVNVAAEPGNEFVSSLQNTDTLEEYGYERPEITGYGQKLRHLDSLRHFVALERHGHVEQSEHKAKSFVDETVGHVIDQLRRSLKTEEGSDFLDARARCRYARETGKGHYFATVTPLEEEDDVWSGAGALACSGQVPNLHFSMMTDAYNSFGWEPFILDSVYKESPLREHNIVPGDAIVSVNGQSFRTLADFNNLVLAGSSNIVLELVRLDEAEATSKHQADELFAMEAEVSRRASIVALTAFRFGGFKQMAASKLQAAGRGFLLRKKSRTLISGGSSLVADAVTTLDNESPQVQVVAMVERNREKGARKALEKRDQEFVEGAVQFVRSQLAAVVELDSMREQLDTWAILVWARIRDMLKTIQVNQNSATVPLGIDGEVPALFSINFKKLMRLSLSEASFFRVESVANGCALEVEGVKPGDLVLSVNGHGFVNKEEILKQARSSKSLVLEVLPKGAFDRVANDARDHRLASQWSAVRRSVVAELSQRAEAQAKAAAVDALHTSSTAITRIQASARGWVQRQRALEIYHQELVGQTSKALGRPAPTRAERLTVEALRKRILANPAEFERQKAAFVDAAVTFVRSQLALSLQAGEVKDQIDRLAQMEWSRKTGFVKTVVAKRSSPTEKLQAAGEVPPQFVIAFDKLMNFPLSPAGHVIMISVGPHSLLKQAGVQAGDFILKVNGKGFSNVQEFSDLTAKKTSLLLEVLKATDLKTVVAGLQDSVQADAYAVVRREVERQLIERAVATAEVAAIALFEAQRESQVVPAPRTRSAGANSPAPASDRPANADKKTSLRAAYLEVSAVPGQRQAVSIDAERAEADAWVELTADDGQKYYYNEVSHVTAWDKPEGVDIETRDDSFYENETDPSGSDSAAISEGQQHLGLESSASPDAASKPRKREKRHGAVRANERKGGASDPDWDVLNEVDGLVKSASGRYLKPDPRA